MCEGEWPYIRPNGNYSAYLPQFPNTSFIDCSCAEDGFPTSGTINDLNYTRDCLIDHANGTVMAAPENMSSGADFTWHWVSNGS